MAAASTATLVVAGLVIGSGTSSAVPIKLNLTYSCTFPLIGVQPIKVEINTDIPDTIAVGTPAPAFTIKAISTVPATATQGLTLVGATTIEGTADASSTVAAPEATLPVSVPTTIPQTAVPASGEFTIVASGQTPSLTFSKAGQAVITVGDLLLHLEPKKADGTDTGLGKFDSACKQDPGQNNTLTTITITDAPPTTTTTTTPPVTTTTTTTPPVTTTTTTPPVTTTTTTPPVTTTTTTPPVTTTTTTTPPVTTTTTTPPVTTTTTTPPVTTTTTPPVTTTTTTPPVTTTTPPVTTTTTTPPVTTTTTTPPVTTTTTTPPVTTTTTTPGGGTINYGYGLKGSSVIRNLNGTVPLSGGIDASLELATGKFSADLSLNPTHARFSLFGFLPVSTDIAFSSAGRTTGSLSGGKLISHSKLTIKLPRVTLFGIPISSSPNCRTSSPSDIDLSSDSGFDPLRGGKLSGTYGIAPLTGCGLFTGFISAFTTGGGNTIDVTLSAKK
ncbi:hypothetical protein GCM10010174_78300 [Kutzneria viridogrisea]|uniref:DUF6801 domain-containing protein n=1 Tax=Kutzneria viridogrisea TaxID=47990 RepID=A0ABR6BJG8_9PSEU|nr:DUF6801 domain-containing protein [Kutzneria albida]MBA8927028.1 hypothetical protein [Kutzneria viridogrisea]